MGWFIISNCFGRWSSNLYISLNENDWHHSARVTSPEQHKKAALTMLILSSRFPTGQQQDKASQHDRAHLSFLFLLASSKVRPVDTRENILSLSRDDSNSRQRDLSSRESTFQHLFLCFFSEAIPYQLFLPPKSNGPWSFWLSTKFLHSYLHQSHLRLRLTAQRKTSSQAVIKASPSKTINIIYFLSI